MAAHDAASPPPYLSVLIQTIRITDLAVTAAIPEAPTRPPILFIHGILGGPGYFENDQRWFAARGYPRYAVSLRGRIGRRETRDVGSISREEFVTDAMAAARALGRPIIVGHAMGGLVAQRLAEEGVTDVAVFLSSASPRGINLATPRLVMKQLKHLATLARSRPLIAGDAAGRAASAGRNIAATGVAQRST